MHRTIATTRAVAYINDATNTYVSSQEGVVAGAADGAAPHGALVVEAVSVQGWLAYVSAGELVNTAPLSGTDVTTALSVVELYNRAATASAAQSSGYTCSALDTDVLSISSGSPCTVVASSSSSAGAATTLVEVSRDADASVVASVPLRVWHPLASTVRFGYSTLYAIKGASQAAQCAEQLFQSTTASLVASFGGSGLTTVADVDMTREVTLVSADTGTATVSTSATTGIVTVSGVGAGSTSISAAGSSPTIAATIVVSTEVERLIASLRPVAFNATYTLCTCTSNVYAGANKTRGLAGDNGTSFTATIRCCTFMCSKMTPLGFPVDPEVNRT